MIHQILRYAAPTAAAALLAALGLPLMRRLGAVKPNFAAQMIPSPAGFIYLGAALAGLGAFAADHTRSETISWAVSACAFFALGLTDDLWGRVRGGGFRGHFRETLMGRPTTALVKAIGGGIVALWASWRFLGSHPGSQAPESVFYWTVHLVLGAGVVALSANAVNLLDLRPGRAAKAVFVCLALFAVARPVPWSVSHAGAVALGGWLDARGVFMMGDSGSNLLGCIVGLTCLVSLPAWGLAAVLAALVWTNLYSEWKSITRLIETTPFLAALDRLGTRY